MIALIILTFLVLTYLFYPIRSRAVNFDEKSEVIKIHREEVAYIKQQHQKALIDDNDKAQWLAELDRKSATSMLAIEQRAYAYRSAIIPILLLCLGIGASGLLYTRFYQGQSLDTWHSNAVTYREAIIEGLFDDKVVTKTIAKIAETTGETNKKKTQDIYCFLLQHHMLRDYAKNPDVLMNVAECHLQLGYRGLAQPAIANALREDPNHLRAITIDAQLQLLQQHRLTPETQIKLKTLIEENPSSVDVAYLVLLNHFSLGEFSKAKEMSEKLQPHVANDPKLKALLSDIKKTISKHNTPMSPTTEMSRVQQSNKPIITIENGNSDIEKSEAHFSANVVIAPSLRTKLVTPQILFVIVKSPKGQLLTAGKFTLTDIEKPLNVTLKDGDKSLMQMRPMRNFEQIQITARISLSGQTLAQPGDLTSVPATVHLPQHAPIVLNIDQTIE